MRLVVDLDGTLCRTDGEDYGGAEPIEDRIKKLRALADKHEIIISTARGSGSGEDHWQLTARQLSEWQVPYDELRVGERAWADLYIDDRAKRPEEFFGE